MANKQHLPSGKDDHRQTGDDPPVRQLDLTVLEIRTGGGGEEALNLGYSLAVLGDHVALELALGLIRVGPDSFVPSHQVHLVGHGCKVTGNVDTTGTDTDDENILTGQ